MSYIYAFQIIFQIMYRESRILKSKATSIINQINSEKTIHNMAIRVMEFSKIGHHDLNVDVTKKCQ